MKAAALCEESLTAGTKNREGFIPYESSAHGRQEIYYRWFEPERPAQEQRVYLFLHGLSGNSGMMKGLVAKAVAEGHRVITLDLINCGRTLYKNGLVEAPKLTEDPQAAIAVLSALKLTRVHLMGHSRGGAVALQIAALRPELVASVTSISSYGEWMAPETVKQVAAGWAAPGLWAARVLNPWWWNPLTRPLVDCGAEFLATASREAALGWYSLCEPFTIQKIASIHLRAFLSQRPQDELVEGLNEDQEWAAALQTLEGMRLGALAGESVYSSASKIPAHVPVLLLYDSLDALSPSWVNERLAAQIRHGVSDGFTLVGAGHLSVRERPEMVYETMNRFIGSRN